MFPLWRLWNTGMPLAAASVAALFIASAVAIPSTLTAVNDWPTNGNAIGFNGYSQQLKSEAIWCRNDEIDFTVWIILQNLFFLRIIFYRQRADTNWTQWYFYSPWCRCSPYIVGIIIGFLLYITQGKTIQMPKASIYIKIWFQEQLSKSTLSVALFLVDCLVHQRVIGGLWSRLHIRGWCNVKRGIDCLLRPP